ncbi:helix-turn-helix domain-containing protein [Paenibacillus rhizoplanae]
MEGAIHVRIGQNLQRIRKQRGLSLDKLAALTNVSKGMLHQMERGDIQPTVTIVWKNCNRAQYFVLIPAA